MLRMCHFNYSPIIAAGLRVNVSPLTTLQAPWKMPYIVQAIYYQNPVLYTVTPQTIDGEFVEFWINNSTGQRLENRVRRTNATEQQAIDEKLILAEELSTAHYLAVYVLAPIR